MQKERKSFFERLTGVINTGAIDENDFRDNERPARAYQAENRYARVKAEEPTLKVAVHEETWVEEDEDEEVEGELTVDVYQTANDIIIQTMAAGVRPDDLDIAITRESVTIKGKREAPRGITDDDYSYRELYWGPFSRTVMLPQEVETDGAEAIERFGLLTIRLPKIDKNKAQKLKIKSV